MRNFLAIFLVFIMAGCGYRPIATISNDIFDSSVFVNVKIDKKEPKNSVWITDAVKEGVVSRLGLALSNDESTQTRIDVAINSLNYTSLSYDELGYITAYKVVLSLGFKTTLKDGSIVEKNTSGEHDFSVSRKIKNTRFADSVISDTERFEAIKEASKEAFDEYISYLAIIGLKGK